MFPIRPEYVKRISFATKLFPKIKSPIGLDITKLKSSDQYDGELFCGGRSRNKDLLTFFGFIASPTGSATFVQLSSFRRSLKKLINLVEQELEILGAQEILMPTLVPLKLWYKSNRFTRQQNSLDHVFKLTDKDGTDLLLGPTFEETITKLIADFDSVKESDLPLLLYQTSPKFRSEACPRFGLIRSNEFFMNDLYTFDTNLDKAKQTYSNICKVYDRIFKRLGLNCLKVQSHPGNIGGKYSHEYQLPVSSGEDTVVECNECHQAFNIEMYSEKSGANVCLNCDSKNILKSQALELGHTFLLSDTYSSPMGAKYTKIDDNIRENLEMGCYGLGLTRIIGAGVDLMSLTPNRNKDVGIIQLRWPNEIEPYKLGIISPAKRSKQYHGGATNFIQCLVTRILESTKNIDLIVEDRDKEGISRRLIRLQSLGIPYIITVGRRFLHDQPEVELLKLDPEKINYEQSWLSPDQLYDFILNLDN